MDRDSTIRPLRSLQIVEGVINEGLRLDEAHSTSPAKASRSIVKRKLELSTQLT